VGPLCEPTQSLTDTLSLNPGAHGAMGCQTYASAMIIWHICLTHNPPPRSQTHTHLWAIGWAKLLPACAVAYGNCDCTLQHTHTAAGQAHTPACQLPECCCKAPALQGHRGAAQRSVGRDMLYDVAARLKCSVGNKRARPRAACGQCCCSPVHKTYGRHVVHHSMQQTQLPQPVRAASHPLPC
jgi:hypothetical protein